jgi:hypothetical protein
MSRYSHYGWLFLALSFIVYGLFGMLVKPEPFDESKFIFGSGKILDAACFHNSGAKLTISNFEQVFYIERHDNLNTPICADKNENQNLIGKEASFTYIESRILALKLNGKNFYEVSDVYAKKVNFGSKAFFFGLVLLAVAVVKYTHNKPFKQDK